MATKAINIAVLLTVWSLAGFSNSQKLAVGERWAVATGHPMATAAGIEVMRRGGNVIDAAVAASLTLGVAEPYGSGLGGKLVLLYHDASTGEVSCIEALCVSPADTQPQEFAALSSRERKYGYRSVCVPGLPSGLYAAHQKWGEKPWGELVAPAEKLAGKGIIVSEAMRSLWAPHEKDLAADPEARKWFLVDGKTPDVGDSLPNPDLAATLKRYASNGDEEFRRGETAQRIVEAANQAGASLSLADFAEYKPRFTKPLAIGYCGYRVFGSPPPLTGGVTVLAALKAQEVTGPPVMQRDADYIDRLGRILQVFYPRISRSIADTRQANQAASELLSINSIRSAAERAEALDPKDPEAMPVATVPIETEMFDEATLDDALDAGTTHLVVADAKGNMVSLTQSLSLHFGAAVVAPGTGVVLNDSMSNFATTWKASPNYIHGAKRPRSTVSPVIATRDGLPSLALGIPGGQRIPTTTLQLLVDILGAAIPIDEAFARPRFHLRRPLNSMQAPNIIDVEEGDHPGSMDEVRGQLKERGWLTEAKPQNGRYFGGGNAIQYQPRGKLTAVADPRRTNQAAAD